MILFLAYNWQISGLSQGHRRLRETIIRILINIQHDMFLYSHFIVFLQGNDMYFEILGYCIATVIRNVKSLYPTYCFFFLSDLIQCTNEMNVNIPQLADTLFERTANGSWVVVFKALITTHHLMMYGNEVSSFFFVSYIMCIHRSCHDVRHFY